MPKIFPINVRALAEFALLKGDLVPAARMADRMLEGTRGHREVQASLGKDWSSEVFVARDLPVGDAVLRVQGRADAVCMKDGRLHVMEIKTTNRYPASIGIDEYPAHLAQGQIYAYLFCLRDGLDGAEVSLRYYRLDGAAHTYRRSCTLRELEAVFLRCAEPYARWIVMLDRWREEAAPSLQAMRFPYDRFREGQQEMAEAVQRAMRHGNDVLIEAPTGIGKTAASLYGALKALGRGEITAVFYLTARTTGRRAAQQALDLMRAQGLRIRSAAITAKDKVCPMPQRECFGCPYASDYYTRRRDALREAMGLISADAESVGRLAMDYELCPYELMLDISEQADVIICDYNYVFDPRVRLKRYFDQKSKAGLLIDEAHNLPDRARDMLSAQLSGEEVERLRRLVGRYEGRGSPAWQSLSALLEALTGEIDEPEAYAQAPNALVDAAQRFVDEITDIGPSEPELVDLMYEAIWFVRTARRFDETAFRALKLPQGKRFAVRLWCYNPAEHIHRTLNRVGGAALFSATLAPMNHYAAQMGLELNGADEALRLESPFPPRNQLTLRLPVSVKLSDRARTMEAVAQVLHGMTEAHTGNYLACFPSFAYMEAAFARYRMNWPDDRAIAQRGFMNEKARAEFIAAFEERPKRSLLAFVVLGGVFAEGVDLPGERLSGAAVVSTGMPQLDYERGLMAELYDDGFGAGGDVAYTYPGLRRVLQAAGRVIRTETDRGVVLLIDTRYDSEAIRELLPANWHPARVRKLDDLKRRLAAFWSEEPAEQET